MFKVTSMLIFRLWDIAYGGTKHHSIMLIDHDIPKKIIGHIKAEPSLRERVLDLTRWVVFNVY